MDVRQLEYFIAVAEELNFTLAAARCHVVQSALSYQVARLEREHGLPLFERTSRSVRLTAAGERLLPRARAVLDQLDTARAELAELAGVITGRLRLGIIGSTGQAAPVVERTLAAFHHRHPAAESAFIEMRAESGLRHQVDAAFARARVTRRIAFELSTSDAVVRFVALGFGPAVVPRSAAATRPHAVAVLELADPAARHPISLIHRHPEPTAPSARAFLTLLATFETPRSTPPAPKTVTDAHVDHDVRRPGGVQGGARHAGL